jgi:hypothetical protein
VKLLLLQQWYGLSDPGLEEAVDDRLSFRRFAGLPLDESVPDHSTIWRFRQELAAHGLAEALFEEINRQLDARGLIVRQGTLIDATLLQASVKPPSVKEGTVSERDAEAGWTKKNGKSHFGYKGDCQKFRVKAGFHQASLNRSSNRMASWAFAITHSLGGIFHSLAARFNTRNNSLSALSSVGKCPLVLTARRSLAFKLSIEFVV